MAISGWHTCMDYLFVLFAGQCDQNSCECRKGWSGSACDLVSSVGIPLPTACHDQCSSGEQCHTCSINGDLVKCYNCRYAVDSVTDLFYNYYYWWRPSVHRYVNHGFQCIFKFCLGCLHCYWHVAYFRYFHALYKWDSEVRQVSKLTRVTSCHCLPVDVTVDEENIRECA